MKKLFLSLCVIFGLAGCAQEIPEDVKLLSMICHEGRVYYLVTREDQKDDGIEDELFVLKTAQLCSLPPDNRPPGLRPFGSRDGGRTI